MKTADELLKELGYEKKLEDKYNINYIKMYSFINGDRVREQIRFCKLDKYVYIENFNYDTGVIFGKFLDIKELQAINKKCQELRLDMKQWKEIKEYFTKKVEKEGIKE